jgi:hypothetical protein
MSTSVRHIYPLTKLTCVKKRFIFDKFIIYFLAFQEHIIENVAVATGNSVYIIIHPNKFAN